MTKKYNLDVYVPHDVKGKFDAVAPISVDPTVYFDNTGDIIIGSGCSFSRGVMIYTHEHWHDRRLTIFEAIAEKGIIVSPIQIEDDVYIGAGAIILASCNRIGKGAVIGAGSVVTCDIPSYEIWAGNPARFIKSRE